MSRPASSVLVCRGCCCGSATKHPEVDHEAQVTAFRNAATAAGTRFHTVECLGPCERANVVVVRDGADRHWFGAVGDYETATIADWLTDVDQPLPTSLEAQRFEPPGTRARRRLLPERGADLADVAAGLTRAGGTWTMGVPGAIAEFDTAGLAALELNLDADEATLTAVGSGGGMRLSLDGATRLFAFGAEDAPEEPEAFVVVRTGNGLTSRPGVTEVGPDPEPILRTSSGEVLFDLGLGRDAARFMVRVDDRELAHQLQNASGEQIDAIEPGVWQALVAASPTRVVETALGRIEVSAPIPPPGGESPTGSHTHLLPDVLAVGLDLPDAMTVPKGWHLGPIYYPARRIPQGAR
ncbi:MAG: hypothetical protein AAGC53_09320 [Actinomycetota bacterium]